jgi:hypothetical protein
VVNNKAKSIAQIRKKTHSIHEFISTAIHESGHTIYGLLHLIKINSVCVFENKKSKRIEGYTDYIAPILDELSDSSLFSYYLDAEICFKYAGLSAENILFYNITGSNKFPMFIKDGSYDDTKSASYLINRYNLANVGKDRLNYKRLLKSKVKKRLLENWEDVTLISHRLFEKKKLSFDEVKLILLKKSKNKKFWKDQFKYIADIYNTNSSL